MPEQMLTPAALTSPGHAGILGYTYGGMGNRGNFDCICTCGWQSTWEEWYPPLDTPVADVPGLYEEFVREVQEAGGMRAWNAQRDDYRYGNREQALADLLAHLGLSIQQARAQAAYLVQEHTESLVQLIRATAGQCDDLHDAVKGIQEADSRLHKAERLVQFLDDTQPDPFIGLPGRLSGSKARVSVACGELCRPELCRECPEYSRDEIVPGLWVGGGRQPLGDFQGHVLTLDDTTAASNPYEGETVVVFPDADMPEQHILDNCVQFLDDKSAAGEPVLIRCHSGLNRAPLIAAYWLITRMGVAPWEAVECLRVARGRTADYPLSNMAFVRFLLDARESSVS